MAALVEFRNVSYRISGREILRGIDLRVEENETVVLLGRSGSGKTTLLTLLSGQEKPSKGSVEINSVPLDTNNAELNGVIGYVPQDDLLIEDLTVYQNLYYNAKLCFKDASSEDISKRIENTLRSLGL